MVFKLKTKQKLILSLFFIFLLIGLTNFVKISYSTELGDISEVIQDTYAHSGDPDNPQDNLARIATGRSVSYRHAYLEFNTSTVPVQDVPFVYIKLYGEFHSTKASADYVNFRIYTINEEWNENTLTWNNAVNVDKTLVDILNITVLADLNFDWYYLNITDSFETEYGESFNDFYGYMIYFEPTEGDTVCYFDWYSKDNENYDGVYIYYSETSLDCFGNPYSEDEGDSETYMGDTNLTTTQFNDFMFLFLFLIIPPMILGIYAREIFGIAFVGGLGLMAAIGKVAGIVDLWFLLLIFIVIAIFLFAQLKRGIFGF